MSASDPVPSPSKGHRTASWKSPSCPLHFTNKQQTNAVFLSNGDESSKTWLVGEVEGMHPTVDLYETL